MTHLRSEHAAPTEGTWRIGLPDDSELVLARGVAGCLTTRLGASGPAELLPVASRRRTPGSAVGT